MDCSITNPSLRPNKNEMKCQDKNKSLDSFKEKTNFWTRPGDSSLSGTLLLLVSEEL